MLIEKAIGNTQFNGAVNKAGRSIRTDREFVGDAKSTALIE